MLKRLDFKKLPVSIIIALTTYAGAGTAVIITLGRLSGYLAAAGSSSPERELLWLKNWLAVELLFIFIFTLFIIISAARTFRLMLDRQNGFDSVTAAQQKEIERQFKSIGNLTSLYNDIVEYDRQKTEFFANISHDLKTPLSVILGSIQLLDQKGSSLQNDDSSSSKHFKVIKQNCYRLVRLINNILDITRIDSGYIKVNLTNCNLVYLIEEITQSVVPYAEQKGLSVIFDTELEEIHTAVDTDKIERVILNLLSNAMKFTKPGGTISVKVEKLNDKARICVKDTGFGIPREMQQLIFERFKQVNSSLTKDIDGSGIGLSLVKSFVELHKGSIKVNSEENKGSEFIIELPVRVVEPAASRDNCCLNSQDRITEAINIELSDMHSIAS